MSKTTANINLLGCLPFLLGCLILGSLGFCGTDCQSDIHAGIRQTKAAWTGE